MKTYRVLWEIDKEADSPEEAARQALDTQRRYDSIANIFDVIDSATGMRTTIDLEELKKDAT